MVLQELMCRYPFFACLTHDQIVTPANAGEEINIEAGHHFFHGGDSLKSIFFVLEGSIDITVGIPDISVKQDVREGIMGNFIAEDVTVNNVTPGQIFAWSAMIPPNVSTASATSKVPNRVVAFDCEKMMQVFQKDSNFGYRMLQKVAGVSRQCLRDMRRQ